MCVHIAYQEAFDQYVRHVALMAPLDCYVPKHHIVFHLLADVGRKGNPRVYATWLDEALNKTLKKGRVNMRRNAHSSAACCLECGICWPTAAVQRGAAENKT